MTLNIIDGSSCAKHSIEVEIGIACASRTLIAHSNPHPEIVKVRSKGRWARGEGRRERKGKGWRLVGDNSRAMGHFPLSGSAWYLHLIERSIEGSHRYQMVLACQKNKTFYCAISLYRYRCTEGYYFGFF